MNDEGGKYHKVAFDGRLQYHQLLKSQLEKVKESAILGDINYRYRALRTLFSSVAPYIRKENYKKIKPLLMRVNRQLSSINSSVLKALYQKLSDELDEVEELIHFASDELFLPKGADDEEEVDWDKIARDS